MPLSTSVGAQPANPPYEAAARLGKWRRDELEYEGPQAKRTGI